ncbi:hypothetical protein FisN_11Lh277 [Fistulifera solaris]|uniref:Ubiquitin-like domain-containing protein n=1 Tax=Fistulifera solaris TaxID=1519565 RepID=A0A1Z5J6X8_FISSO|nr:hypothetical protein FisN_11Lh277 [Fistulifera solaris]|eukprot:GAX09755.1 hypothetical protein FisN_11Lh277 [Fistulifera solaris]
MSALTIQLTITGTDGAPKVPLTIEPSITSTQLRQQVAEATKIPLETLKLIFRGRIIANNDTQLAVSEFKLEDGSVLHCMGKPAPAASTAEGAASSQTATTSNVASAAAALPASRLSFNAFPSASVSVPDSTADPLQAALATLRAGLSPADYLTAVQTLEKIVSNIVTQPMEEKYRSLKKSNVAFQRKLGGKRGGDELMKAAGFIVEFRDGMEYYALQASAEAWPKLVATHGTLQAVVRQAQALSAAPTPSPVPPTMGSSPNLPFNFDQIPSDFMSNPAALQAMLQDPMVQNMIRNDPRFRNNPYMEQMLNNPALLQQVSQAMQDPAMRQQMQQRAADFAGGGLFGDMPPSFNNFIANNARNRTAANQEEGASDEQMTEEEMIAEAIRRSLQDGS